MLQLVCVCVCVGCGVRVFPPFSFLGPRAQFIPLNLGRAVRINPVMPPVPSLDLQVPVVYVPALHLRPLLVEAAVLVPPRLRPRLARLLLPRVEPDARLAARAYPVHAGLARRRLVLHVRARRAGLADRVSGPAARSDGVEAVVAGGAALADGVDRRPADVEGVVRAEGRAGRAGGARRVEESGAGGGDVRVGGAGAGGEVLGGEEDVGVGVRGRGLVQHGACGNGQEHRRGGDAEGG
mmetsp:Transcript_5560/g.11635  ORF Transcript_5560/g.11635 Transcript_5560/m.11635 type:complete len:238 (+) Transcript_5560:741-1454(+)